MVRGQKKETHKKFSLAGRHRNALTLISRFQRQIQNQCKQLHRKRKLGDAGDDEQGRNNVHSKEDKVFEVDPCA